jgi:hypothetical protein
MQFSEFAIMVHAYIHNNLNTSSQFCERRNAQTYFEVRRNAADVLQKMPELLQNSPFLSQNFHKIKLIIYKNVFLQSHYFIYH